MVFDLLHFTSLPPFRAIMQSFRNRYKMAKKIIYMLIVVGFAFVILEIALRILGFSYQPFRDAGTFWDRLDQEVAGTTIFQSDPALFWRLKPNMNKHVHPDTIDYTTTNSDGYRGPSFPLKKPAGRFRIICIGDSSTFGDGVRDSETFAAVTEKLLKEKGNSRPLDVINAGIPGYTSHQTRKFLEMELLELSPDIIVVMVGANDMVPAKNNIEDKNRMQADDRLMKTRTRFGRLRIYQALMALVLPLRFKTGSTGKKVVLRVEYDDFVKNLCAIKSISDRHGFSVILMTVPHVFDVEHLMNPHTRIAASQCGAHLLDLSVEMKKLQNKGLDLYREDGGHPNVLGHKEIAKLLSVKIANLSEFKNK